jgi:hypothetical protein
LAALVVWTKNWSNWYGQSGILLVPFRPPPFNLKFNVFVGDGILMNAIEIFRPFDVLIPRKILAKKALTQTSPSIAPPPSPPQPHEPHVPSA